MHPHNSLAGRPGHRLALLPPGLALPHIRAGRLRAIGITSLKPSPIAPELTPMSSAVAGYEYALWWGLLAPAGTPAAVVGKLNAAVNQALARLSVCTG